MPARPVIVSVSTLTLLASASLGTSAPEGAAGPVDSDVPPFERDRLTGDWWGARSHLEDAGLTIGGEYIAEFTSVLDGGLNERGSFRNLLTIDAELDLGTAIGLEGGAVFIQYLSVNADSGGSADAGDLQVFSNIENDRSLDVIYELWYEQTLFDERLRFKVGKVDANSEFNFVDVAGDFANSSAGFSPTIFTFPSYPDPAMSVNVFATVVDTEGFDLTLGYGLYDGAAAVDGVRTGARGPSTFFTDDLSDDFFHIWQADLAWDALMPEGRLLKDGRVSVGGWYHDGDFERFDGGTEDGAFGFFVTGEIRFFDPDRGRPALGGPETAAQAIGQAGGEAPHRGLYLFAQYGWADEDIAEVAHHFAAGVVWRGPSPVRPDDSIGLYVSAVDLSDNPAAGFDDNEVALDTYYRLQLTPAIFVQPELQYIINPSGDPSVDDALVAGLRVGVAF
ncbi:MAG: carbohydrate porin [Planctomycetota bacterium]